MDFQVKYGGGGGGGGLTTLARKQIREEVVQGHLACDMAPFLWRHADRFVSFDLSPDTVIGSSTPNAIAMDSGQTGEMQWSMDPREKAVPVLTDPSIDLRVDGGLLVGLPLEQEEATAFLDMRAWLRDAWG